MKMKNAIYLKDSKTVEKMMEEYKWLTSEINLLPNNSEKYNNPQRSASEIIAFEGEDGIVYSGFVFRAIQGFKEPYRNRIDMRIPLGKNQDTSGIDNMLKSRGWTLVDVLGL